MPRNNITATPGVRAGTAVKPLICPSDIIPQNPGPFPSTGTPTEWYGATSYKANGGSRPVFATSSTNDGMFMATGPAARRASGAPAGIEVPLSAVLDGTSNTILFGERSHVDPNFDRFTTQSGWTRWYPAGGDNGLGNLMCGAFAPINYRTPFAPGQPGAPTSQSAWFVFMDQRLSAIGSQHPGGANVVFTDGSVRFLTDSTSQIALTLMCRRADGQVIPN